MNGRVAYPEPRWTRDHASDIGRTPTNVAPVIDPSAADPAPDLHV